MQLLKKITFSFLILVLMSSAAGSARAVTDLGTFGPATVPTPSKTSATVDGGTVAPPAKTVDGGTLAPAPQKGTGETIANPLKGITSLPDFLKVLLAAVIQLGEVVIVLAFVWIGFLFVKAQGAPAELKKAREAFFWTIIGALILLSANAILAVVQSTATSLSN